jgi:hypothetical protein
LKIFDCFSHQFGVFANAFCHSPMKRNTPFIDPDMVREMSGRLRKRERLFSLLCYWGGVHLDLFA